MLDLNVYSLSNMRLNYSRIHATCSNFKHSQISGSGALQLSSPDILQIAISSRIPDAGPDIHASLVLEQGIVIHHFVTEWNYNTKSYDQYDRK